MWNHQGRFQKEIIITLAGSDFCYLLIKVKQVFPESFFPRKVIGIILRLYKNKTHSAVMMCIARNIAVDHDVVATANRAPV